MDYIVEMKLPLDISWDELRIWLSENCSGSFSLYSEASGSHMDYHMYGYLFKNETDAMAAKLRWL